MNSLCSKYSIDLSHVKTVEWKTQLSNNESILFYTIGETEKALNLFKQRIQKTTFKYCIVNKVVNIENVICVDQEEILPLQKEICDKLLPFQKIFKSICITGTNGKTTTVDLIRQICLQTDHSVLTIGTLGVWLNNECVDSFGLTSPSYIDFRRFLNLYASEIELLVIEASSHALIQKRFFNFLFDWGAWTSFSQDHLDYHNTMDKYFNVKKQIFNCVQNSVSIIDTESFLNRIDSPKLKKIKIENFKNNKFLAVNYNKKNMTLALDLIKNFGVRRSEINISEIEAPPGRFNILNFKDGHIVIDFAHTPDALLNICQEIKDSFPDFKLIIVFGCGGDRDKTKRPLMGKVAVENSDFVYITSDNPRFEDPKDIIKDIVVGLNIEKIEIEEDRKKAIKKALLNIRKAIILIAGKGHEKYIDQNGVKRSYNDEDVVKKVIQNDNNK